jgi:ribosomal protein S19
VYKSIKVGAVYIQKKMQNQHFLAQSIWEIINSFKNQILPQLIGQQVLIFTGCKFAQLLMETHYLGSETQAQGVLVQCLLTTVAIMIILISLIPTKNTSILHLTSSQILI